MMLNNVLRLKQKSNINKVVRYECDHRHYWKLTSYNELIIFMKQRRVKHIKML